jgi:hypothetical protein
LSRAIEITVFRRKLTGYRMRRIRIACTLTPHSPYRVPDHLPDLPPLLHHCRRAERRDHQGARLHPFAFPRPMRRAADRT